MNATTTSHPLVGLPEVIGASEPFLALLDGLVQCARTRFPMVIVGEPGTGKRLLAHGVHTRSEREGPLLSLECSELPEPLLARELLGDARSQGLLDRARGGSLLLLHIDGLGRRLERRLMRRYGGADAEELPRLLATLKRPSAVESTRPAVGGTLQTLFGERAFAVPPLRHRLDDLELLSDHFLERFAPEGAPATLTPSARFALQSHRWPGNVRELAGVLQQAAEMGGQIGPEDLAIQTRTSALRRVETSESERGSALAGRSLKDIEAEAIRATLSATKGNRSAAARTLGVSRPTLLRKIKHYQIDL